MFPRRLPIEGEIHLRYNVLFIHLNVSRIPNKESSHGKYGKLFVHARENFVLPLLLVIEFR